MSESLNNLNTLATSLPLNQQADQELLNNFKAAAQSITTLYRSSRENSKRSYNQGYVAACKDLMTMIQQGVSSSPDAMAIGKVLDWLDARVEEVRSREEEEAQEEEESSVTRKPKMSSSPSPPPVTTIKAARPPRRAAPAPPHESPVPILSITSPPETAAVGAKRRHAVMMMLDRDSATPPASSSTTTADSRRRTRSIRGSHVSSEPMDTDEDGGRERKRVARR